MDNQIDDIEIRFADDAPAGELLEEGPYLGKLIGFKVTEKPEWKQKSEQVKYPKKTIDPNQWEWRFQLTEEGYEDVTISDWTSCTFGTADSPHKATARIYAACLLGKTDLDGTEDSSTRMLINKPIELWLVKGEKRNFINAPKCRPVTPRQRPQRPQAASTATQKPAVGRVSVPGLGDRMYEPEDDDQVAF